MIENFILKSCRSQWSVFNNSQRSRNAPYWFRNIILNLILFTFLSGGFKKSVCELWENKKLTFDGIITAVNFVTTQFSSEITRRKIKQIHGKNAPEGFHRQGLAANNSQVLESSVGLKIGELRDPCR